MAETVQVTIARLASLLRTPADVAGYLSEAIADTGNGSLEYTDAMRVAVDALTDMAKSAPKPLFQQSLYQQGLNSRA